MGGSNPHSSTIVAPCYCGLGMSGLNVHSYSFDWPFPLLEQIVIAWYFQLCRCTWPPFFTAAFYTSLEGSTKTFLRTKHFVEVFISGNGEAVDAIVRCSKPSGCVWNSFEAAGSQILAFQCERVLTSIMEVNACHEKFIHSFWPVLCAYWWWGHSVCGPWRWFKFSVN